MGIRFSREKSDEAMNKSMRFPPNYAILTSAENFLILLERRVNDQLHTNTSTCIDVHGGSQK
jgi:hypothetical protein